jgi:heme A synthase
MLDAALGTAGFLGLACVVLALWRKDLYRQGMLGWCSSMLIMGIAQLLRAAQQPSANRVLSGVLGVVAAALVSWSVLRQGRRPPISSPKDSPP